MKVKNIILGSIPLLLIILGITFWASGSSFSEFPSALVAWGTLMLAIATFMLIRHSKEQEEQRRETELLKEKRGRKERILNEIIEWAIRITTWRSENRTILREMAKVTDITKSQRLMHAHIAEVRDFFVGITGLNEYVVKIASGFQQGLPEAIEKLIDDLKSLLGFLEEWQLKLVAEITSSSVDKAQSSIVENSIKADDLSGQVINSVRVVLEKAAEIKTRDVS